MLRLMLNGKLPTKEELMTDDLILQMMNEAKAEGEKGKEGLVTKDSVIQSLTPADVPDAVKIEIKKDAPTKDTVLQALTVEDVAKLPDAVKNKVLEDAKQIPAVVQSFVDALKGAVKGNGNGTVTDDDAKPSILQQMVDEREAMRT